MTQENARQLENYQNLEHKILDGVKSAADELVKTFESLLGEGTPLSNVPAGALQNGAKFMEQALTLLGGENDPESAAVKTQPGEAGTTAGAVNGEASEQAGTASAEKTADMGNVAMQQEGVKIIRGDLPKDAQGIPSDKIQEQLQQEGQTQTTSADSAQKNAEGESFKELLNLIKGEKSENVPDKIIQYMSSGKAQFKDIRQFLLDTEFGKSLTPEQKAKIFHSDPFKSLLKDGLQKQWTLTPEELFKDGKVEEFYQKLLRESSQLTKLMNEAMQSGAQSANAPQAKAMGNIAENVEFINQMNQMLNYVQLPLKLGNSQAHGDLYVYTNKKHMARGDGMLTAFLHLDMDYLGSLDVSIALQTQKGQITTKFYLDEDSIALVEEHIGELSARLEKKGYRCKNMILEKDEDKTVLEHVEEQVAAGSAVIGYQTFDTRA